MIPTEYVDRSATLTRTPYGALTAFGDGSYVIRADASTVYEWAHRTGACWPCATLPRLGSFVARFDRSGDLVDLYDGITGGDIEAASSVDAAELTAWQHDVIEAASRYDPIRIM